ncbi:MAG TPA: ImmA/IrrE family metallo-endopeptidase [Abditibacteriaceae bacterium]
MNSMKACLKRSPMTFAQIEEYAQQIAQKYNFSPQKKSVRAFARELGGNIEVLEIPKIEQLHSGSLKVYGENNFTIYLSPITSALRDNFTIAHEMGHYFLHILPSGLLTNEPFIEIGRHGEGILEQQANRFAAALLMPRNEFIEIAKQGENLNALAGRFRVSVPAAQVRLESLKKAGSI